MDYPILERFNLSYSTYHTYLESQVQFFFYKILQAKPDTVTNQSYGTIGNVIHSTLEQYIKSNFKDDPYQIFDYYWEQVGMDNLRGFRDAVFDKGKYEIILTDAIERLEKVKDSYTFEVEKEFLFTRERFHNLKIHGYIDVIMYDKEGNMYLADWKTDSQSNYQKHYLQRLFYSWACWVEFGKIPKKCQWLYLNTGATEEDSFSEEDIKQFDKQIQNFVKDILQKGTNVENYEIGKYKTPFNSYKGMCMREETFRERKKNMKNNPFINNLKENNGD